jgi:ribosomal protein L7/L12
MGTADLEEAVRALTASLEAITARLNHMEAQAAAGFKQTGQNVKYTLWSDAQSSASGATGVPDAVVDAVRRGKTVEAITRYRDLMGTTNAEAKAAVEALAKQLSS